MSYHTVSPFFTFNMPNHNYLSRVIINKVNFSFMFLILKFDNSINIVTFLNL